MTPFPKDDNKDHNPEIEQTIQDRIDRTFDESNQAEILGSANLPGDWHDNRPFDERYKDFGLFSAKTDCIDRKTALRIELIQLGAHSFWFNGSMAKADAIYWYGISVKVPGHQIFNHSVSSGDDGSFPPDVEEILLKKAIEHFRLWLQSESV